MPWVRRTVTADIEVFDPEPWAGHPAGALPVGEAVYEIPEDRPVIYVAPDGSDQTGDGTLNNPYASPYRAERDTAGGACIVMRGGTYEVERQFLSKPGVTLQPYPGEAVWFDGTHVKPSEAFAEHDGRWVADHVMTTDRSPSWFSGSVEAGAKFWTFTDPDHPLAGWPEKVYLDGVELTQVASLDEVGPGRFYLSGQWHGENNLYHTSDRLHLGDDPAGREVRVTFTEWKADNDRCLSVVGPDITIKGVGFRRWGTHISMHGTVFAAKGKADRLVMENVHIVDSSSIGMSVHGNGTVLRQCTIANHGMLGLGGGGDDLTIDSCRLVGNNSRRFYRAPVAGGAKLGMQRGSLIVDSLFAGNHATGLWYDELCYDATVVNCDMVGNTGHGFVWELSTKLTFVNNRALDNQAQGFRVDTSSDVTVWNNTFARNGGLPDPWGGSGLEKNIWIVRSARVYGQDVGHGYVLKDVDRPFPDPTVSWDIHPISFGNNVVGDSPYPRHLVDLEAVHGGDPTDLLRYWVTEWDGNLYNLPPGTKSAGVMQVGPGDGHHLPRLVDVQALGYDQHSAEVRDRDVVNPDGDVDTPGTPVDAPDVVRQLVGFQPQQVGAWRPTLPVHPVEPPPPPPPPPAETEFSIAVVGDTQVESLFGHMFWQRAGWLAANKDRHNIKAVVQVGDLVNWDNCGPEDQEVVNGVTVCNQKTRDRGAYWPAPDFQSHWQYVNVDQGLRVIEQAGIPWVAALGNHDSGAVGCGGANGGGSAIINCGNGPGRDALLIPKTATTNSLLRTTGTWNHFFPPARFRDMPGVDTFDCYEGKTDTYYITFTAGGLKWMILSVEVWPRQGPIDWCKQVVAAHPDHNVIITTHMFINGSGTIDGGNGGYGNQSPQHLWNELVSQYRNIFMVCSGHTGTTAYKAYTGKHGNTVHCVLDNYASDSNNDQTRMLWFNTAEKTVTCRTINNTDRPDEYRTSGGSRFDLTGVEWVR